MATRIASGGNWRGQVQHIGRRAWAMLSALAVLAFALLIAFALASYSSTDPALNTAAAPVFRNVLGPAGAWSADLLLTFFGLPAILLIPPLVVVALRLLRGVHPGLNEGRAEMAQLNAIGIESRNWDHAAAMRAIERARQTNAWIIFYTHDVCDTPGPYGATPAMLADVLDGLIAAGIPMLPMREAMPVALGQAARSAA